MEDCLDFSFPAPSSTLGKDRMSGAVSAVLHSDPLPQRVARPRRSPRAPPPASASAGGDPARTKHSPGEAPRAHIPKPPLEAVSQTALYRGRSQASSAQPSPVSRGQVARLDCGFEAGAGVGVGVGGCPSGPSSLRGTREELSVHAPQTRPWQWGRRGGRQGRRERGRGGILKVPLGVGGQAGGPPTSSSHPPLADSFPPQIWAVS